MSEGNMWLCLLNFETSNWTWVGFAMSWTDIYFRYILLWCLSLRPWPRFNNYLARSIRHSGFAYKHNTSCHVPNQKKLENHIRGIKH